MARVAVLFGGLSAERPVSLSTGAGVLAALQRLGQETVPIDPQDPDWLDQLRGARVDAAFNVLHGPWGEDGAIQGVLEYLRIPYTHSGVLASALAMDKDKAKTLFARAGLPVAKGMVMNRHEAAKAHPMPVPYVVKPVTGGSSIGVFIVREGANRPPEQLLDADWSHGEQVMIEEFVAGREFTVSVLGEKSGPRALCVTEIIPAGEWYDYNAKYAAGGSRHELPARIPEELAQNMLRWAAAAHACLGCRGLTRTDFKWDPATGQVITIELNTQPGMTLTSLSPEQAAYCGMSYDALVAWLLEDASCQR
jgi:D-alanine-D-alanine ligase